MFEFNYIIVNATSEFACCLEDLAFALQAEVISDNILRVDRKLVDRTQFEFVLPIYFYELVELSAFSFSFSTVFTDILIQSDEELYALAGENLWGEEEPRVIEHIPAMTDEEFSSILPTIWD